MRVALFILAMETTNPPGFMGGGSPHREIYGIKKNN